MWPLAVIPLVNHMSCGTPIPTWDPPTPTDMGLQHTGIPHPLPHHTETPPVQPWFPGMFELIELEPHHGPHPSNFFLTERPCCLWDVGFLKSELYLSTLFINWVLFINNSSFSLPKETICDAKRWMDGGKMWSKVTNWLLNAHQIFTPPPFSQPPELRIFFGLQI